MLSIMAIVLRWFLQLFLGATLLALAVGKALDLPGFVEVLKTYRAFPNTMLFPLALAVASAEFVLGAWLLSGWHLKTSALVAAWLNAGYALWMTVSLLRGLELANCGCFGVFFPQPLSWFSPLEDVVMVAVCLTLRHLAQDENKIPGALKVFSVTGDE